MIKARIYYKNGSVSEIDGACELEFSDLYPEFEQASFADTKELEARSFGSMQLRAKNAVRSLLHSKVNYIAQICISSSVDGVGTICDIVTSVDKNSDFKVLLSPKRAELFGSSGIEGYMHQDGIYIMPCSYFNDHPEYLGFMDRALYENKGIKLILFGDAADCAQLNMIWPCMAGAVCADLVLEFPVISALNTMGCLVKSFAADYGLKDFDSEAIRALCVFACRQSGDRRYLGLNELTLKSICAEASNLCNKELVCSHDVLKAIAARDFRVNFIAESGLRDHKDRQILLCTSGAVVGQINGLSVIETVGTSYEFGEPVRITATLRAGGEGDIIDIERKAELAGQIHAKAMMIINGFITKEFSSCAPLPVSASLVFEQSYSEVDGDSASLTGLCAVLSALANVPLRQDLAVTGAVDQFGDVQAVGGVNEKIEGFYKVCRLHGFTGTQGVIIPQSCINQLVLRPCVVEAVKAGRFHIYTVSHVKEAIKLLTTLDWGDDETAGTIRNLIATRLYEIGAQNEEEPWWSSFLKIFKKEEQS